MQENVTEIPVEYTNGFVVIRYVQDDCNIVITAGRYRGAEIQISNKDSSEALRIVHHFGEEKRFGHYRKDRMVSILKEGGGSGFTMVSSPEETPFAAQLDAVYEKYPCLKGINVFEEDPDGLIHQLTDNKYRDDDDGWRLVTSSELGGGRVKETLYHHLRDSRDAYNDDISVIGHLAGKFVFSDNMEFGTNHYERYGFIVPTITAGVKKLTVYRTNRHDFIVAKEIVVGSGKEEDFDKFVELCRMAFALHNASEGSRELLKGLVDFDVWVS